MSTVWSFNNINVNDFFQLIDSCKGNVYLVTDEGDKLNLKSKLCQLIGVSKLIEGGIINGASLVCDSIEDEGVLVRYKLYKLISKPEENEAAAEAVEAVEAESTEE